MPTPEGRIVVFHADGHSTQHAKLQDDLLNPLRPTEWGRTPGGILEVTTVDADPRVNGEHLAAYLRGRR